VAVVPVAAIVAIVAVSTTLVAVGARRRIPARRLVGGVQLALALAVLSAATATPALAPALVHVAFARPAATVQVRQDGLVVVVLFGEHVRSRQLLRGGLRLLLRRRGLGALGGGIRGALRALALDVDSRLFVVVDDHLGLLGELEVLTRLVHGRVDDGR